MESGGLCRVSACYLWSRHRPCQLPDCTVFHFWSGSGSTGADVAIVEVSAQIKSSGPEQSDESGQILSYAATKIRNFCGMIELRPIKRRRRFG